MTVWSVEAVLECGREAIDGRAAVVRILIYPFYTAKHARRTDGLDGLLKLVTERSTVTAT